MRVPAPQEGRNPFVSFSKTDPKEASPAGFFNGVAWKYWGSCVAVPKTLQMLIVHDKLRTLHATLQSLRMSSEAILPGCLQVRTLGTQGFVQWSLNTKTRVPGWKT